VDANVLAKGVDTLPPDKPWGYRPGRTTWRVCSFEPNLCMVKTSLIPLLVCEEAYAKQPSVPGEHEGLQYARRSKTTCNSRARPSRWTW
jgi:hypothetical protein